MHDLCTILYIEGTKLENNTKKEHIMKQYVDLKPLADGIKKGSLKAQDLVELLLSEGFSTSKDANSASLSDLSFDGKSITSCKIDTWQMIAHVNLG